MTYPRGERRGKKLPSKEQLKQHVESGLTNKEIAAIYHCTTEAVRKAKVELEIMAPRDRSRKRWVPWKLPPKHQHAFLKERLALYGKAQEGEPLTAKEREFVREFTEFMDGDNSLKVPLSVHYDRNDPDGFWLAPRQPGDRDYIHPPARPAVF